MLSLGDETDESRMKEDQDYSYDEVLFSSSIFVSRGATIDLSIIYKTGGLRVNGL